jgi:hypothetical protein
MRRMRSMSAGSVTGTTAVRVSASA